MQQIQTECDHCHGSGRVVSKQCPACSGHGIVDGKEEVEAVIERGMADGAEIVRIVVALLVWPLPLTPAPMPDL